MPKGILLKELSKEHPSIQRNPLIAHVFYVSEKIEKWGRGTIDMIQDCKEAGNPAPKYKEIGGSFSITLPLREPIARTVIPQISAVDISARQKEILNILRQGPLNRKQILSAMKNPPSDRTAQVDLLALSKLGLIVSEGKGRALVWAIPQI